MRRAQRHAGLWASWMDRMVAPAQATAGQGKPRWQITTDAPTPDVLAGGVKQLEEGLAKDVALNVDRLAACLEDRPLTPTRKSRFAALAA